MATRELAPRKAIAELADDLALDQQRWIEDTYINPETTIPQAYMQGYRDGMEKLIAKLAQSGIIADFRPADFR